MDWDFKVRGYAGMKHPHARPREWLGETSHRGLSSLQMEIMVWQTRCARGDASHCEIIDLRPGGTLTMQNIDDTTKIDWKEAWRKL